MDETRTEKRVAEFDFLLLLLLSVDQRQLRNHEATTLLRKHYYNGTSGKPVQLYPPLAPAYPRPYTLRLASVFLFFASPRN